MVAQLYVKTLSDDATIPTRGSIEAAGLDLYASQDFTLLPGNRALISTGIAMSFRKGFYVRIAPRSGLAVKNGIDVLAGVVDSDYRGEVKVALINLSKDTYVIHKGDRIAQAIMTPVEMCQVVQVYQLDDSARGEGGYGSTGN